MNELAEGEEEGEEEEEEEVTLEEAMAEYKEQAHDCMTQVKAFISFFQVGHVRWVSVCVAFVRVGRARANSHPNPPTSR